MARTEEQVGHKPAAEADPVISGIQRALDYTNSHMNQVLGVAAGVIIVVALGVLWSRDRVSKTQQSAESLSAVISAFGNGAYDQSMELATAAQTQHPGTPSAALATYFVGASQLRLGRFAEAEASLRAYLAQAGKAPFYEQAAQVALGAALEGQKKYAEAAQLYQTEAAKMPDAVAADVQLDAARALRQAGQKDQAREILQKLAEGTTAAGRQAKIDLAVLNSTQP